jgi:hypothetical protein
MFAIMLKVNQPDPDITSRLLSITETMLLPNHKT